MRRPSNTSDQVVSLIRSPHCGHKPSGRGFAHPYDRTYQQCRIHGQATPLTVREDEQMSGRAFPLLLLPTALLAAAPLTVLLATDQPLALRLLLPITVVSLLPALTPVVLRAVGRRWDPLLLSAAWVLVAFGLAVTARVQPPSLPWQAL